MSTATLPTAAKNRRQSRRKLPRSSAKLECYRGTLGLGANLAIQLLDISECGVGLIVKASLNVHEEMQIVIRDYGQSKSLKQLAKVCWCLPLQDGRFCAGLSFEKWLSYADIQLISKP